MAKITKSDAEWRKQLTPEQYRITREHGTERPCSHPYNHRKDAPACMCARACGKPLFSSDDEI